MTFRNRFGSLSLRFFSFLNVIFGARNFMHKYQLKWYACKTKWWTRAYDSDLDIGSDNISEVPGNLLLPPPFDVWGSPSKFWEYFHFVRVSREPKWRPFFCSLFSTLIFGHEPLSICQRQNLWISSCKNDSNVWKICNRQHEIHVAPGNCD